MFLLVDHTGNATQSSHTRQKGVVEQPAQLEDWIHITTVFVYEQRNMVSCKVRSKQLSEVVESSGKTPLCIPSPLAWVRCLTHNICSTCY